MLNGDDEFSCLRTLIDDVQILYFSPDPPAGAVSATGLGHTGLRRFVASKGSVWAQIFYILNRYQLVNFGDKDCNWH